ncbi:MAG TPA: hypothetical protein VEP94_06685, partial [Solirubrobacterales bacterium]|nr:hypothetical protein [Solirubrobacterales bacterium]
EEPQDENDRQRNADKPEQAAFEHGDLLKTRPHTPQLTQLSQLERLTGIFWGFADENGSLFKGWLLEIACSEDQAPFQGRGLA